MSIYNLPDVTAVNPLYAVGNLTFRIFKSTQKIIFESPVYADSLVICKVSDGLTARSNTPLKLDEDYKFNDDDVDYTTMSRMPITESNPAKKIIKSVTFTLKPDSVPLPVVVSYQGVYASNPKNNPIELGGVVELTPSLLVNMLTRIGSLELSQVYAKNNTALPAEYMVPKFLEYDRDCTRDANIITDEKHIVSSSQRQNLIIPLYGSFFAKGLQIALEDGTVLTRGTDYTCVYTNFPKLQQTADSSGIYDGLLISRDYEGAVTITYHAVGGDITRNDLMAVYSLLYGMRSYMDNTSYVNSGNITTQPIIQLHTQQLNRMENAMRILQKEKNPNYGNSTNGVAKTAILQSTNTSLHWWTLASLYKVSDIGDVVIKDRMRFHLQLSKSNYIGDVSVSVNLASNNPVSIETTNVVSDMQWKDPVRGYTNGYPSLISIPHFRVIWSIVDGKYSGAYLQIGLSISGSETLAIEDYSGVESCWMLNDEITSSPSDTNITLPDNATLWASGTNGCKSISKMSTTGEAGLLIYSGSGNSTMNHVLLPTNTGVVLPKTYVTVTNPFGDGLDLNSIKYVEIGYTITTTSTKTVINNIAIIPMLIKGRVNMDSGISGQFTNIASGALPGVLQPHTFDVYMGCNKTSLFISSVLFIETSPEKYDITSIVLKG